MSATEPTELQQLERAIWALNDWLDMMEDITTDNEPEWQKHMAETRDVVEWLRTKRSAWETRVAVTPQKGAAEILAGMLSTWQLPGAIWYRPKTKRWRLCGTEYNETQGEFCLGVFSPDSTAEEIAAEIEAFEREQHEPAPKAKKAAKPKPLIVADTTRPTRMTDLKPSVVHTLKG